MRKLLLFSLFTLQLSAYQEQSLPEITQTILTYLELIQTSTRPDHVIWSALASPVCNALINPANNQPYSSPPSFTPEERRNLALLSAYTIQQKTLDSTIYTAISTLEDVYSQPRRGEKYTPRSHAVDAITDRINQSYNYREHARHTNQEDRKTSRFRHEEKVKEKQLKRYEHAQRKAHSRTHNARHTRSKRRLYLENQERLADQQKIWRSRKKQEYEDKLKTQHAQQEVERLRQEQENRERERQRLLAGSKK